MRWPLIGTLAAIAVTTAMDAGGLSVFSALPLLPLGLALWWIERHGRGELGLAWGRARDYLAAALYPAIVIGAATAVAFAAGAVDLSATDWNRFWINFLAGGASTVLGSLLTEEGFFRGWLWASLRRAGSGETRTLLLSSAAFALWHLSAVLLPTGFDLPLPQVPVYMANAFLLGLVWGLLRRASGSVLVASVSHGLWNGLAYALFAFGTKVGALGVTEGWLFGPEVGLVGLALNGAYATFLWRRQANGS